MASVTRVTSKGWGSRLGSSIKGVVFGVIMIALGVMLLFWGEGRAVKRAKALKEGASTVITVDASGPQAANEGKLVHFGGETASYDELRDEMFGVRAEAVKLERVVEMYQWREDSQSEERKKLGGGTETVTTYTYEKAWSDRQIDSGSFEEPAGHQNPSMPYQGEKLVSDPVVIGDWILGQVFVAQIDRSSPVQVGQAELDRASSTVRDRLRLHDGGYYLGANPQLPEIGDVRINFRMVPHTTVSVVGRQVSGTLVSYEAKTKSKIHLLDYGTVTADAMFETAKQENTMLTWLLRLAGFVILFIGFGVVLKPLSVLADVVPFFGNVVAAGTGFVAFVLAAMVGLVTIAIGWIFYRPLLGILLLLLAGFLIWWLIKKLKKSEQAIHDKWTGQPGAPPSAPPPPGSAPPPPPPPPSA